MKERRHRSARVPSTGAALSSLPGGHWELPKSLPSQLSKRKSFRDSFWVPFLSLFLLTTSSGWHQTGHPFRVTRETLSRNSPWHLHEIARIGAPGAAMMEKEVPAF